MSGIMESVKRVVEGTIIVAFSAILIGAGTIVWTAATSYKQEMKTYFEASTEVFSTDIADLSSEVRILREEIEQLQQMVNSPVPSPLASQTVESEGDLDEIVVIESQLVEPIPSPQQQYQSVTKDQILNRINTEQQQRQQTRN